MALVVGTNTYATLAEFKTFCNSTIWNKVSSTITVDATLETYLTTAFNTLSRFLYTTSPTSTEGEVVTATTWIKSAQYMETIQLILLWADPDIQRRISLQMQGVKEIYLQNILKEVYKERGSIEGLYSREAFNYIRPYILRTASGLTPNI